MFLTLELVFTLGGVYFLIFSQNQYLLANDEIKSQIMFFFPPLRKSKFTLCNFRFGEKWEVTAIANHPRRRQRPRLFPLICFNLCLLLRLTIPLTCMFSFNWFQSVYVKANKRIQAEEEEKKALQEKQAKLECIHVCIAMVIMLCTAVHGK